MENKKCKRLCNGYIQNQRINVWDMKELTWVQILGCMRFLLLIEKG